MEKLQAMDDATKKENEVKMLDQAPDSFGSSHNMPSTVNEALADADWYSVALEVFLTFHSNDDS